MTTGRLTAPEHPPIAADYWTTRLAGATAAELPADLPYAADQESRPAVEEHPLAAATAHALTTSDGPDGEPAVLLAALCAVLHRHTGSTDLLTGLDSRLLVPVQGAPDGAAVLLPIRIALDPAGPFGELLRQVRVAMAEARAHAGELPHSGESPQSGDRDGGPLRTALCAADPGPAAAGSEPPLALALAHRDGAALLRLRYDRGRTSRSGARWLLGHLATLLAAALADPAAPVRELPVQDAPAPDASWPLAVPPGHRSPAPPGAAETLVDRFRAVAAEHADTPAVTGPSGAFRYGELDALTTALADRLLAHAGPGDRVALLCDHDIGAVAGVWSVLKSGAAYVPLDPRQPDGRLARILANAEVTAVACDPALEERARRLARQRPVLALDLTAGQADSDLTASQTSGATTPHQATADPTHRQSAADPTTRRPTSNATHRQTTSGPATHQTAAEPPGPAGREALAYLLHTSGSTGTPKAVLQSHGNVLAHALRYAERIRLGRGEQVPLLARFTFDAGVMDLFGALLTGATLHVVDPLLAPAGLRGVLAAANASVLHCTPTLFRHLVGDLGEREGAPEHALAGVRLVVLGGEEATRQDLLRFLAVFGPDAALVNGLGPTECTLALQHLATRSDLERPTLPVGRPVPGMDVRLLDSAGRPTELFGELEFLGDPVALGYWRQEEATAAAFRTHPDGTRGYRTGDLARRLPDGSLLYLGRRDRQVKIRGHRIEPGEIESALRAHPTVAQAAVVLDGGGGSPRLLAYVSSATAIPPDGRELLEYLGRTLPDYAVPALVVPLESMPVGPTGKLDRSRLPAPETAGGPTDADDDARPRTDLEHGLVRIWCGVLGLERAGLHDNFLASGGDSLRMLALLDSTREEYGVEIPLLGFLAAPTVATLARIIERRQ
ncbi:AMP-binding protein [Kitasatospora sp. NPDC049285]|uniref:amino acid adenylation domain-containing protein n=1 Tax=Kitasatospora sp. NPDC049285 TaxID=3157096 RepID=UPI00341CEAD4